MMTASAATPFAAPRPAPPSRLEETAYRVQQLGLVAGLGIFVRVLNGALAPSYGRPTLKALGVIQGRFEALLQRDLANAREGLYPKELLFQIPYREYAKRFPLLVRDARKLLERARTQHFDELPADVVREKYPAYYLRTFHWQKDGWLSRESAQRYDLSVEALFGGAADVMRRMAIPHLVEKLSRDAATPPKILDIACGTGRFLSQVRRTLPDAHLYGVDLSAPYVAEASRLLASTRDNRGDVSLLVENAEKLPLQDATFDAASSVFLFHELPSDARRNVAREAFRVLKPGARFVVNDAAQLSESPEIAFFLESFPAHYHEPYFKGYIRDDLRTLLEGVGFRFVKEEAHFVSKVVVVEKP